MSKCETIAISYLCSYGYYRFLPDNIPPSEEAHKRYICKEMKKMKNEDLIAFSEVPIGIVNRLLKKQANFDNLTVPMLLSNLADERDADIDISIKTNVNPNKLIFDLFFVKRIDEKHFEFSVIETNGSQHYKDANIERLTNQLAKDAVKAECCKRMNIKYFELDCSFAYIDKSFIDELLTTINKKALY